MAFAAENGVLTEEDMNLIIDAIQSSHSSIATEVLRLLGNIGSCLMEQHVSALLEFLDRISTDLVTESTINFADTMASRVLKAAHQRPLFLSWLWKVATDEQQNFSNSVSARRSLERHLHSHDFHDIRWDWIEKLVARIQSGKSVSFCYPLLGHILVTYPISNYIAMKQKAAEASNQPFVQETSREDIVATLEAAFSLFNMILDELDQYKTNAKKIMDESSYISSVSVDYFCYGSKQMYIDEIRARLYILELLVNCLAPLNEEECEKKLRRLWDLFVVQSCSTQERNEGFSLFSRLRQIYHDGSTEIDTKTPVAVGPVAHWIFGLLLSLDPKKMEVTAFECFQNYFVDVNVQKGLLRWKVPRPALTEASQRDLLVLSSTLDHYHSVWAIVLNATNEAVARSSMNLLYLLHENLDISSTGGGGFSIGQLRESFISTCLEKMEILAESGVTGEEVDLQLERCLSLLTYFIKETEGKTTKSSKILSPLYLPVTLYVVNHITLEHLSPPNPAATESEVVVIPEGTAPLGDFEIHANSNATLATLKLDIYAKLKAYSPLFSNVTPSALILSHCPENVGTGADLKFEDFNLDASLEYLNLTTGSKIQLSMTPLFGDRYTHNRNATDWKSVAVMPDLQGEESAASKISTLSEFYTISKELAKYALSKQGWSLSQAASMLADPVTLANTEQEAFEAGHIQSISSASAQQQSQTDNSSPSHIIAGNKIYTDKLLHLFVLATNESKLNNNLHEKLWSLLLSLPPPNYIASMLNDSHVEWTSIFSNVEDPYSLLYTLQVLDSFFFNGTKLRLPEDGEVVTKKNSQMSISILLSATETVLTTLQSCISTFCSSSGSSKGNRFTVEKECLSRLFRLASFLFSLHRFDSSEVFAEYGVSSATAPSSSLESISTPLLISFLNAIDLLWTWIPESYKKGDYSPEGFSLLSYYFLRCFGLVVGLLSTEKSVFSEVQKIFSSHLLDGVQQEDKQKESNLMHLLASPSHALRQAVCAGLVFLVDTIKDREELLGSFFHTLEQLEPLFAKDMEVYYCTQFYNLYSHVASILSKSSSEAAKAAVIRKEDALIQMFYVARGKTVEPILGGQMKLLASLLSSSDNFSEAVMESAPFLVQQIHNEFLFPTVSSDSEPSTSHAPLLTNMARTSAFNLLLNLSAGSREAYATLISLLSVTLDASKINIESWSYQPETMDKSCGFVGLKNLGATCYMNALLQQLYNIYPLRRDLLSTDPSSAKQEAGKEVREEENMLVQLQVVFSNLQESVKMYFDPESFCRTYKDNQGRPVNLMQQQDVNEFFNHTCAELEERLKGTPSANLLSSTFGVRMSTEISSLDPAFPYFSEHPEAFYAIPLEVKGASSLTSSLDKLVSKDKLEDWNCEKYNRPLPATKRYAIKSLSNILIFNLKRFDYDYTIECKIKVNDYFYFPTDLDMKPWTQEGLWEEDTGREKPGDHPSSYFKYRLAGVVVHSGSADSGHYISYICVDKKANKWLEFNDRVVSNFNVSELGEHCFGGLRTVQTWDSMKKVFYNQQKVRNHFVFSQN